MGRGCARRSPRTRICAWCGSAPPATPSGCSPACAADMFRPVTWAVDRRVPPTYCGVSDRRGTGAMSLRTPRPHTVQTVCEHGDMCVDDRSGHAVTLLRTRLAHLAPGGWLDARVLGVRPDGVLELERWS